MALQVSNRPFTLPASPSLGVWYNPATWGDEPEDLPRVKTRAEMVGPVKAKATAKAAAKKKRRGRPPVDTDAYAPTVREAGFSLPLPMLLGVGLLAVGAFIWFRD